MNDELQRYLDGEISLEELSPELRPEALRWEARLQGARTLESPGMPAGLEARIMRDLAQEPSRSAFERGWAWLTRPRQVTLSPLTTLTGAAAALLVVAFAWWMGAGGFAPAGPPDQHLARAPADSVEVIVEFALEAPGARSVSVAGDFTGWSPAVELQDPDGDGLWAGRVRITPGIHKYMFVIDGSDWVTDPRAARHVDDGFGNRNAILVVPGGVRS
jgi:hypothetical protein